METTTIEIEQVSKTKKTVTIELPYYCKIRQNHVNHYYKVQSKFSAIRISDWPERNEVEISHMVFLPDLSNCEISTSEEFQMALCELKRHINELERIEIEAGNPEESEVK